MRRLALLIAIPTALLAASQPAAASVSSKLARFPAPPGCQASPLPLLSSGQFCTQALLVTATNGNSFTVTDGTTTASGHIAGGNPGTYGGYGWALGPLTAGQVVTLWGSVDPATPGALQVTRWLERTHGSPRLTGAFSAKAPYRMYTALDISRGKVPENRMAWSLVVPFLELPQTKEIGGDGDDHVQAMTPCPGAGLTTELVPELGAYVDSPYILPPVDDPTNDAAKEDMRQAPPLGVPVVILGGTRWDPGYGWWELHPIRAWRFPTAAEVHWAAEQCAHAPVPALDSTSIDFPVPYGAPSCGQSPVEGDQLSPLTSALGFKPCGPVCSVVATAIGQPETLAPQNLCAEKAVKPIVDRSQLNGTPAPIPQAATLPPAAAPGLHRNEADHGDEGDAGHENEHLPGFLTSPSLVSSLAQAYCSQPLPPANNQGDPFSSCRHR